MPEEERKIRKRLQLILRMKITHGTEMRNSSANIACVLELAVLLPRTSAARVLELAVFLLRTTAARVLELAVLLPRTIAPCVLE